MIIGYTGLEQCKMLRPAYAVEYDYLPAHQCDPSLQTKRIAGLFFSGQLNGTTGANAPAPSHDEQGATRCQESNIGSSAALVSLHLWKFGLVQAVQ